MYDHQAKDRKIIAAQENIREKEFWTGLVKGEPLISCFPFDYRKITGKEYPTDSLDILPFTFTPAVAAVLVKTSKDSHHRLHIVLTAAAAILMNKYSRWPNQDILVIVPIYRPQLDGEFINTVLPLRIRQASAMTFMDILKEVSRALIAAVEHENYPVELLFDRLPLDIHLSGAGATLPGTGLILENIHNKEHIRHLKLPLVFSFRREDARISGELEYNSHLCRKELAEQLVSHLGWIVEGMISDLEAPVSSLEILSEEERKRLWEGFSGIAEEKAAAVEPMTSFDEKLQRIWGEVLDVEMSDIGAEANFFELNGSSLRTLMLISRIYKEFEIRITLSEIFNLPTFRRQAGHIKKALKQTYLPIEPVEMREYYPLSSLQKRLYFIQQVNPDSISYNVPSVDLFEEELDKDNLRRTFWELIRRHESFRTSFELVDEVPVQRIYRPEELEFDIHYHIGHTKNEMENIIAAFLKPFHLSKAPLLRVGVIHNENKNYIMLDTHHIVLDLVSNLLFKREFRRIYKGNSLPPVKLQYKDFSQWQNSETQTGMRREQEIYWLKVLEGNIPILHIPTDYSRPEKRNFAGRWKEFDLPPQHIETLNRLAIDESVTPYMIFLAIYNIMLAKISGQEDIIVGTAMVGRNHPDLHEIIGMFVNVLALRNFPSGEKTFLDFLRSVKKNTLSAFDNQDYHFEELVDHLQIKRDINRNPLFDVMFNQGDLGIGSGKNEPGEIPLPMENPVQERYEITTSKFDLTLFYLSGSQNFVFEYSTELFEEKSIEEFIKYFKEITATVIQNTSILLKDIVISHNLCEFIFDGKENRMEFEFEF
ncbi:MAG: hypothetical protein QG657_5567 [Acidobacteriota bacterium]|nr:hypothetical protein [Acidobacteriota bacterium]